MTDVFPSVFTSRYLSADNFLAKLFSERHKVETMRELWCNLAEAELEVGLARIAKEQVEEMRNNVGNIDFEAIRRLEKEMRHDVFANIRAFELVCPKAAGVTHLGATSCDITDNVDLLIQRDASDYTLSRLRHTLDLIGKVAVKYKSVPCVGRTHLQPASIVTVGKRAALWTSHLIDAAQLLLSTRESVRFRGLKGATGTQDSFLKLFGGNSEKVDQLEKTFTKLAGFEHIDTVTGQTYNRARDTTLLFSLAQIASACQKIAADIRFLQAAGEILEPFEAEQVGSSAMPYKRNPMRSERVCSVAYNIVSKVHNGFLIAGNQFLERTLDDSLNRRETIPSAFLATEVMLRTLQNIFRGLEVKEEKIRQNLDQELPFLAMEEILMALTSQGKSRQEAHERIRQRSLEAKNRQNSGEKIDISFMISSDDGYFDGVENLAQEIAKNPLKLTGRCVEMVDEFCERDLRPFLGRTAKFASKYESQTSEEVKLSV